MEFYDGKIRPDDNPKWTDEELARICYNCGYIFGKHFGYICPIS